MSEAPSPATTLDAPSAAPPEEVRPPGAFRLADVGLNLAIALAYAVLGVLALRLILAPDFISPVFPAAGLAAAAAVRWGPRVLPGIGLGGVLVSLSMAWSREHFSLTTPLMVGLGGALQAGIGAWLARRWVGPHPLLTEPRELLRFVMAVAGVACLVGPSMGVLALWSSDALHAAQIPASWLSWWIGDTIGVLIATPVALSLFGLPRAHWAPRRLGVALPMLVAYALLCAATYHVAQNDAGRRRHAFDLEAINTLDALSDALDRPLAALDANHSLLTMAPAIRQPYFERIHAERAPVGGPVYALGWAAWVPPSERAVFELEARAEGMSNFQIHDRKRSGDLPSEPDDNAAVIRLIVPLARNRAALGVNVRSILQSRQAQDRAIDTGQPEASEAFSLSQDVGTKASGVVVYRAIHDDGLGSQRKLRGFAFATLRPEDLLRSAMVGRSSDLDYCLIDATPGARNVLMAGDERCLHPDRKLPRQVRNLPYAGRQWKLAVHHRIGLPSQGVGSTLPFVLAGLVGTALLGALLLLLTGRTARVAQLVEEGMQRLRASEERFRSIVEHAPIGVVFADIYARPKEINPYFCQLLGMTPAQLKARSILAITHPDDRAEDSRLGIALIRGDFDRYSRIKRYIDINGRIITVRTVVSLLRDGQGMPYRILGIVEDIGEQLRLQELERIHEAELAANRAKNEFLSRMSHELRTPLNAMLGFAQLLESDHGQALTDRQKGWVTQILQSGWHLVSMINDTLDLSRLDAGQLRVQIAPQHLPAMVADSLAMVETQRQRRQVTLHVDLSPDAQDVLADATRLRQVLINLLSNAVKYNHEGGEVHLKARRVDASWVEVSVADTGPGLTDAQMAQLFQPFNRLGREVGGIEGTGIGLVITQRLLELMNSSLSVSSTFGSGAVFSFKIPLIDQNSTPSA